MNADKFTQKTIETIQTAQSMAQENGNQYLTPEHLLYALVDADGGLIGTLLGRMGVDCNAVLSELDTAIDQLPKMILAAQSADIDALSGCTVSSNAVLKAAKEAIIAEAEEIKDSTAWVETSRKFNELMDRWKRAGRAGRRDDDALWARFRAAADTFFNARQADREQISSSEKENLAKKEELLTKAEALVPVKDEKAAKQARQALAAIQEEWDQIGYVPRDDMHRIESRLDAVDKQIKAVEDAAWKQSDPEADARKSSFEEQLNAQLAELDAQIAAESDPKKKAKLEAEKATKEQWLNAIK